MAEPDELRRFLVPQPPDREALADLVVAEQGAQPIVSMLETQADLPWAGHSARHALDEIYALIPDFGGFVVKANSEGQPGPREYGRSHAEGANLLADALYFLLDPRVQSA